MKIIKLFLVLILGLWAEFKLDVPNQIDTHQLQYIIENGWSDKNGTLNQLILQYGEKALPCALDKMEKPILKVEPTKENMDPVPELMLNRSDYLFVFSYLKYLESQKNLDEINMIYEKALKGLENIDDKSLMSLIAKVVYSQIIFKSLNHSLAENTFTLQDRKNLKSILNDTDLLEEETFWETLEYDKQQIRKMTQYSFFEKEKEANTKEYLVFMNDVYKDFIHYQDMYYAKMIIAMKKRSSKSVDEFNRYMQKEREEQTTPWKLAKSFIISMVVNVERFLCFENVHDSYLSEYIGKNMALVSIPKLTGLFSDYQDLMESRQRLIEKL